jgi:hypothetical protein
VKISLSGPGPQAIRQLAHFFHPGGAAIIGCLLGWKLVPDGDAALPDFFQLRIVDPNGNEAVPFPLVLAVAVNEIVDRLRDLFGCPFHKPKIKREGKRGKAKGEGEMRDANIRISYLVSRITYPANVSGRRAASCSVRSPAARLSVRRDRSRNEQQRCPRR